MSLAVRAGKLESKWLQKSRCKEIIHRKRLEEVQVSLVEPRFTISKLLDTVLNVLHPKAVLNIVGPFHFY